MKAIWIIAKQELKSHFDSLMAYILLILFLGFSGFFTWIYGNDIFFVQQASLQVFFQVAYLTLFFAIPMLTMRSIAEETRSGTIELLLTKPITHIQIIWGKYLAMLLLIIIALALTLPYYFTIASIGNIDHGAVISGYFGLILMSSAYIGIGLFASALTSNQIVSALVALIIGVFFHILSGLIAGSLSGALGQVFYYLSMNTHFESITRGVIDSKDLIYFASLTYAGVFLAEKSLQSKTS
ncbi:MAG: ABC transporter permease subunit [Salinivirgaceae bacterium]|jgi:ABC-2 type transport system permease protein|nr:ABC transporter permease subunit [Salinivirgaceae bacterium]